MKKPSKNHSIIVGDSGVIDALDKTLVEKELIGLMVGHGASILSEAKANWYFGEWHELVLIDLRNSLGHPDFAILSAFKAVGFQQLDELDNCKKYIRIARKAGCDNKLIAKLLIAGVHNTLGKVCALIDENEEARLHFNESVNVGEKHDSKLAVHARSLKEVSRLGLLPQASILIGELHNVNAPRSVLRQKKYDLMESEICKLKNQVVRNGVNRKRSTNLIDQPLDMHDYLTKNSSLVILVAGMRHSGSTALFNILRLAIEGAGFTLASGYSEKLDIINMKAKQAQVYLVKTHELRDDVLDKATIVITSKRDLRDTVASAKRRGFAMLDKMGGSIEYAKYNRSLHELWGKHSNYEFIYEMFMSKPEKVIREITTMLGLDKNSSHEINRKIVNLPTDQYSTTLLSPTHITDPKRSDSYEKTLSKNVINKIEQQQGYWLSNQDYL